LTAAGIESHVVDPASITVSRRHRRAKTDRIDGEALVRTLMAWQRGEPRVCAMVRVPTPEEEDRRRVCREPKSLIGERIRHVNRVKGVLFTQGIGGYGPRNRDRRDRPEELRTGDGAPCRTISRRWRARKVTIVALARKLIVALWKYVTSGGVIEGAAMKTVKRQPENQKPQRSGGA
jgi:transposase